MHLDRRDNSFSPRYAVNALELFILIFLSVRQSIEMVGSLRGYALKPRLYGGGRPREPGLGSVLAAMANPEH